MTKPIEKLYALDQLLHHARVPVSFARICETLECSEATAHRIIKELREGHGAPIKKTRNPHGYIYTNTSYQLPLPGQWFTGPQLHALLLIQQLLRSFQPGLLDDFLEPLREKLDEVLRFLGLPTDGTNRIRLLKMAYRPPGPCFNTIATAAIQRRRMHIRYEPRSGDPATEREVSPQRLIHYRDKWYLDAWCHKQNALRIFSEDCIPVATLVDTPALDIADAEIEREFAGGYGIYAGPVTATACLRFSSRSARWVADEQWHPRQVSRRLESGEYELEIPYSQPIELIMDIMRYGAEVEVLAPAELRQEVAARHRSAADLYR